MNGAGMFDRLKDAIKSPPVNLHLSKHLPALLDQLGPQARILELGCGRLRRAGHIINADLTPYPEVDVVTDAHKLAFKKEYFDAIIADAALEHVSDPQAVVSQMHDALKTGGYIYCEIPFLQIYHPAPRDFRRYTTEGIDQLFTAFHKIDSGVAVGPTSAVFGILQEYVPFVIDIPIIRGLLYFLIGCIGFLLRYLDILLVRKKKAHILASSLYYYGKK